MSVRYLVPGTVRTSTYRTRYRYLDRPELESDHYVTLLGQEIYLQLLS